MEFFVWRTSNFLYFPNSMSRCGKVISIELTSECVLTTPSRSLGESTKEILSDYLAALRVCTRKLKSGFVPHVVQKLK
jgi:hypothetical protein